MTLKKLRSEIRNLQVEYIESEGVVVIESMSSPRRRLGLAKIQSPEHDSTQNVEQRR